MEVKQVVSEAHSEPIICITYNPFQQKLYTGSEDGTIKVSRFEAISVNRYTDLGYDDR
jgi:WD40 repeat protein